MRPRPLALALLAALGAATGCSGGSTDPSQEKAMKSAFEDAKKPVDQLPPNQRASAEAMRAMAQNMAKGGPSAGNGQK